MTVVRTSAGIDVPLAQLQHEDDEATRAARMGARRATDGMLVLVPSIDTCVACRSEQLQVRYAQPGVLLTLGGATTGGVSLYISVCVPSVAPACHRPAVWCQ